MSTVMATPSPPKPWERTAANANNHTTFSSSNITHPSTTSHPTAASSSTSTGAPALPPKPASLNAVVNQNASTYTPGVASAAYNSNPYSTGSFGAGGYGGYGSYNSYASPYSRFGGGGGMYGSYGGYGGYGGFGNSMYGGGMYGAGYGAGRPGMMPDGNGGMVQSLGQSTAATFQIIEGLVGAFSGFAQMLESTYMTTHSSFFAMIAVADQFSALRDTLGSLLGIFAMWRWLRTLFARLTGRPPPADATALTPTAFHHFQNRNAPAILPDGSPAPPRPSKKPLLVFVLAAFGLPYLMSKLIRALAQGQQQNAQNLPPDQALLTAPDGQPESQQNPSPGVLDPAKLDFARLLYDYEPASSLPSAPPEMELSVHKGDLVAILSREDPAGRPSEWWQCRTRDGRVGYLPGPYLEIVRRASEIKSLMPKPDSTKTTGVDFSSQMEDVWHGRTRTMTTADEDSGASRTSTMQGTGSRSREKVKTAAG